MKASGAHLEALDQVYGNLLTGLTTKISDRDVCVKFGEARDCYFCPRFANVFMPQEKLDIPQ